MEARHPRLARVSGVAAMLLGALMIVNAFAGRWPGHPGMKFRVQPYVLARLDRFEGTWWAPTGWYHQEFVVGAVIVALFVVQRRASKPREVPTIQQRSISDQLEDFEAGGITVRSAPQLGGASATTQAIVQSILGNEPEAQRDVSAAIAHLDTDETGKEAARVVAAAKNPQPALVREARPLVAVPTMDIELPPLDVEPTPTARDERIEAVRPEPEGQAEEAVQPVASVPLPVLPKPTPAPAPAPVEQPTPGDLGLDGLLDGLDRLFDEPAEDAQEDPEDHGMSNLLDSLDDLF